MPSRTAGQPGRGGAQLTYDAYVTEPDWPGRRSSVGTGGQLAVVDQLFMSHGMRTEVRQVSGYRETDLYILLAEPR
jgi:hypothetical protein